MADKDRSTKRERRDESKKRRLEEIKRRQRKARMRKVYVVAAITLAVVGLVAWIALAKASSNKKDKAFNAIAVADGCAPLQNPKVLAGQHITPPAKGSYTSNPPTSGEHYFQAGLGPVNTGIHATPVANEGQVHNLEHGHIVIQYKSTLDPAVLEALKNAVRGDPSWMLIAPREDMSFPLVFTAWGHLEGCSTPTLKAVDVLKAFHDRFKNKGPESNLAGTPTGI
jgi:hypothetical protein